MAPTTLLAEHSNGLRICSYALRLKMAPAKMQRIDPIDAITQLPGNVGLVAIAGQPDMG